MPDNKKNGLLQKLGFGEEAGAVFLLAGLLLVAACVVEIFRVLYNSPFFEERAKTVEATPQQPTTASKDSGNVFKDLHKKYPSYRPETATLVHTNIPIHPHNPTLGAKRGDIELVVCTDMGCGQCRREVSYLLNQIRGYMDQVKVVFKFSPTQSGDINPAMFDQLALRAGLFDGYFWQLMKKNQQLSTDDFMFTLERAGLSLTRLRLLMTDQEASIVESIEKDISLAKRLNIYGQEQLPVFYLNGYKLGQNHLPQHKISHHIAQIIQTGGIKIQH